MIPSKSFRMKSDTSRIVVAGPGNAVVVTYKAAIVLISLAVAWNLVSGR